LNDKDHSEFVQFAVTQRIIEARCRKDERDPKLARSIRGMFVREYNIRDYWSKDFQARILLAGKELESRYPEYLKKSGQGIVNIRNYIDALRDDDFVGTRFFKGGGAAVPDVRDEFDRYCAIMPRADNLVEALDKNGLVKPWDHMAVGDRNGVDPLFGEKKKDILAGIRVLGQTHGANSGKVEELYDYANSDNPHYDGSLIERMCLAVGNRKAKDFFFDHFHRDVFCTGLALQHNCKYMQVREETIEERRNVAIYIDNHAQNSLSNMSWGEFSDRIALDSVISLRAQLVGQLTSPNPTNNETSQTFRKILDAFGIKSDTIRDFGKGGERVAASNIKGNGNMYIIDANDKEAVGLRISFCEE
jgi:hypothetical protein